jgi:WD40 repeat protein
MVNDGEVVLWKPHTDEVLATLKVETDRTRAMAISRDIRWLVRGDDDGFVTVHEIVGDRQLVLAGHEGAVSAVAISRDDQWIASAGADGMIQICDASSGELHRTLRDAEAIHRMEFSPDGSSIAAVGDRGPRIWDINTGSSRRVACDGYYGEETIVYSPDGTWLAFAGLFGGIQIADSATASVRNVLHGVTNSFNVLAVSPDGALLVGAGHDDGTVQIFSTADGELRSVLKGHTHSLEGLAFSGDGTSLTSVEYDGVVREWDPTVRWVTHSTQDHTYGLETVASAPDGTWLASAGYYATVQLWNVQSGQLLRSLEADSYGLSAVAVSPDGRWLASAGGPIEIWDAKTGTQLRTIHDNGNAWVIAISPDGQTLASAGSDSSIRVWDARTGEIVRNIDGNGDVYAVVFSPDGKWIASGGSDGVVRIWDAASGVLRADLRDDSPALRALAVSDDSAYIASAGFDGAIRVWDVGSGALSVRLEGHEDTVRALGFSRHGMLLASTGDDGTVRVWDPKSGLCETAMRINGDGKACVWLPDGVSLAVGGASGLYLFRYVPDGSLIE